MPELLQAVCGCLATLELQAILTENLSDDAYFTQRLKLGLHIYICQAAEGTFFDENSRSSQFNVAKALRLHSPNLKRDQNCRRSLLKYVWKWQKLHKI